jgi:threonine/homoserine/homoserine lactone efflux protein
MLSLFLVMLVLAAVPSASVGLVVARSATLGIRNGIAAALGIVVGDLVFVLLAILSLTALAEAMGSLFVLIRYLAGACLIWMGISLLRSPPAYDAGPPPVSIGSMATSFSAGFFLTLGDIKAILFYASLFPAFLDLSQLGPHGVAAIIAITVVTVGGVKAGYALLASRMVQRIHNRRLQRAGQLTAGGMMLGAGAFIVAKT